MSSGETGVNGIRTGVVVGRIRSDDHGFIVAGLIASHRCRHASLPAAKTLSAPRLKAKTCSVLACRGRCVTDQFVAGAVPRGYCGVGAWSAASASAGTGSDARCDVPQLAQTTARARKPCAGIDTFSRSVQAACAVAAARPSKAASTDANTVANAVVSTGAANRRVADKGRAPRAPREMTSCRSRPVPGTMSAGPPSARWPKWRGDRHSDPAMPVLTGSLLLAVLMRTCAPDSITVSERAH